jgi:L-alanine-DL-glutamate epimerase-like enolase superfamily enzyme
MNNLRIDRIEITPTQIKLNEPFVISKGALAYAKNTVIRIHTVDGLHGTGECCLFRSIHAETQEGALATAQILARIIIGHDAREIKKLIQIMDSGFVGHASIKSAFDMALYDLNAKAVGLPLYRYLGGDNEKTIFTDMTISLLAKEKMVEKAIQYKEEGFPALKIKLGERPAIKDIQRVKAIRKAVGEDLPLRIDANQGWNYFEAIQVLEGIKDCNIEYCEAPVPAANILDRIRLVRNSPIPIMGDESIFTHQDTYQNLSRGAVELVNIKLGKAGGIHHANKIAGVAESANVYCQVGCFSETRLGISALVHFAKAWNNVKYYDLDAPLMHTEDPIVGGIKYLDNWEVKINDAQGIGADYDDTFLRTFKQIIINS